MVWLIRCALVLTTCHVCLGDVFRDDEFGYSFVPPEGWVRWGDERIRQTDEFVASRQPDRNYRFVEGFSPADAPVGGSYLLVQVTTVSTKGQTWGDLALAFNAKEPMEDELRDSEAAFADLDLQVGTLSSTVQPELGRVVMTAPIESAVGAQQGIFFIFPGKDELVQLNFYAPEASFDSWRDKFAASADSFQRDQDFVFVSAIDSDPGAVQSTSKRGPSPALLGGIAGGLSALITVLIIVRMRSRQHPGSTAEHSTDGGRVS
ncbi:MAG: hypothetical protein AAGD00_01445 [Planctomycetota bacterium]